MIFKQLKENIERIEEQIQNKSIQLAFEKKDLIISLQKGQINLHLNGKGEEITPPYTDRYRETKLRSGRTGRVDLEDKGDWKSEITAEELNNIIYLGSEDSKNKFIEEKYDPFGLMERSLDILREEITPELQAWVEGEMKANL